MLTISPGLHGVNKLQVFKMTQAKTEGIGFQPVSPDYALHVGTRRHPRAVAPRPSKSHALSMSQTQTESGMRWGVPGGPKAEDNIEGSQRDTRILFSSCFVKTFLLAQICFFRKSRRRRRRADVESALAQGERL